MSDEQFTQRLYDQVKFAQANNIPITDEQWAYLDLFNLTVDFTADEFMPKASTVLGLLPEEYGRSLPQKKQTPFGFKLTTNQYQKRSKSYFTRGD